DADPRIGRGARPQPARRGGAGWRARLGDDPRQPLRHLRRTGRRRNPRLVQGLQTAADRLLWWYGSRRRVPAGRPVEAARHHVRVAGMHETLTLTSTAAKEPDGIEAAALRAEAWAGEPFLRPDEDASIVLAPGTAFRNALDAALAEMEAGHKGRTQEWKVRFALMLGLERVLYEKPPRLASGTELRRHQVDALAGMLTELIAASQKHENGNGGSNGAATVEEVVE